MNDKWQHHNKLLTKEKKNSQSKLSGLQLTCGTLGREARIKWTGGGEPNLGNPPQIRAFHNVFKNILYWKLTLL
jgi:hypothetical protein